MKQTIAGMAAAMISAAMCAGVVESARDIPVAAEVDVFVAGGTAAGVAAARAARAAGATVFLASGVPYVGEDMAGTLELGFETRGRSERSDIVARLRTAETDLAPYEYAHPRKFRFIGGWNYHNDSHEKFSTSADPVHPGDCVLYTNSVDILCTLEREEEIASIEVLVLENNNPNADASRSVDHRGAIGRGTRGPLTGRVAVKFLDGPRAGETLELARAEKGKSIDVDSVRDGEPAAEKETGINALRVGSRQHVTRFAVPLGGCRFRKVQVTAEPASGCVCHLVSRIRFRRAAAARTTDDDPSPLKVKKTFDRFLVESGVRFITGSPVTDLVVDEEGRVAGAVIANRSGRQAVLAKSVVDATPYAVLGRLGLPVPDVGGKVRFTRTIVAGSAPAGIASEQLGDGFYISHSRFPTGRVYRCSLEFPLADGTYRSFAAAEMKAREITWTPSMFDAADRLRLVSPFSLPPAREFLHAVPDVSELESRIAAGAAAGKAAAAEAKARPAPKGMRVDGGKAVAARSGKGDVRELLGGLRPYDTHLSRRTIPSPPRELPVLGEFDVVVAGSGTAGTPAAISSAESGAKTLALEYLHIHGGVSTDGMILGYYDGNKCGFVTELEKRKRSISAVQGMYRASEAWRRWCAEAGVETWFGAFAQGAFVKDGKVAGVVVVTPQGRGVVLAKSVVDATGNSDVAAAAGAETTFISAREFALQSAGQSPHRLGRGGVNSDFGYVNDPCAWDLWLFSLRSRAGAPDAWDLQRLVDSRERRRIVPDRVLEGWDVVAGRKLRDTLVRAWSKQDSHGYLADDYCCVAEADGMDRHYSNVALSALLPKGVSGVAVIGLGKGVARDVVPITRMKADLMNEGCAAGYCAAAAAKKGGEFRAIDVREVQRRLVRRGNLPAEVLQWDDSGEPPPDDMLASAAARVGDSFAGSASLMAAGRRSIPFLKKTYETAQDVPTRQAAAILLGMLHDASGAKTLADIVSGKTALANLRPRPAFGKSMFDIAAPLALGRTRSPLAVEPILHLLRKAEKDPSLERIRIATLAAEAHGSPELAPALARLLDLPGVGGWARKTPEELSPLGGYGLGSEGSRCIRELAVARALVACGDFDGRGRALLEAYSRDPRGVFAEHAAAVLEKFSQNK